MRSFKSHSFKKNIFANGGRYCQYTAAGGFWYFALLCEAYHAVCGLLPCGLRPFVLVGSWDDVSTLQPLDTPPWLLVRERTIPTERPPPVGEFSANFCG